jgi:hypothetical protein
MEHPHKDGNDLALYDAVLFDFDNLKKAKLHIPLDLKLCVNLLVRHMRHMWNDRRLVVCGSVLETML